MSDQRGSVPRYGERVLVVPVSITALNVVRQALALADGTQRDAVPFAAGGKLAGGVFGAVRFSQEGSIGIASLLPRGALSAASEPAHAARRAHGGRRACPRGASRRSSP